MVDKALELIKSEWKLCGLFSLFILFLGALSIFYLKNAIFKIILFCVGLDIYNGFFILLSKSLKGNRVESPHKYLFFGKNKNRYDFIILLVFFGAIIIIFKGPMIIFQTLLANIFNDILLIIDKWIIPINIFILVCFTAYKIILYSAFADLTYHRSEVLEAFKAGIKGVWKFKIVLFFFILFELLVALFIPYSSSDIQNVYRLVNFLVPAFIIILMISYYNYEESMKNSTKSIAMEKIREG